MTDDLKKRWADYICDSLFVRNVIILSLVLFVAVSILLLYLKGDLEVERFLVVVDIAIGISLGSKVLSMLKEG